MFEESLMFSIGLLSRPPSVKKLQDDSEMATTTLPWSPATHFPDILSKQTEASGSMLTCQTQSVGDHTQTL